MHLSLGFSPCPNDTFIFDALVHNKIKHDHSFKVEMADVELLNQWAFDRRLDVTKMSFHAWSYLMDDYQMLNTGAALGFGVGPLLIAKEPMTVEDLSLARIAIPGKYTTANFLLKSAFPTRGILSEFLFSEIEQAILTDQVEAGVIIHENRFTYQARGLHLIKDLGQAWEEMTGSAIPLGGIAVKRSLPEKTKLEIQALINQSIQAAIQDPAGALGFISDHAQEMDPEIMQKHIDLYVNDYSLDLGVTGRSAVEKMLEVLLNNKLIDKIPREAILGF